MQEYQVQVYNDRTEWRQHNRLHRLDGPAAIWENGTKKWYQNGQLHRLDGPAVIQANGSVEYWIDNCQLTYDEFMAKKQPAKELTIAEIEKLLGYAVKVVK